MVGLPASLIMLYRSKKFLVNGEKDLLKANKLGLNRQLDTASEYYSKVNLIYTNHPQILYDQALVQLKANHHKESKSLLLESLNHCSNFYPSLAILDKLNT